MYRDHERDHEQQKSGFKPARGHTRKEWERSAGDQHQLGAGEHSRQPAKALRTHDIREAEAERQIRELRSRY
jgi:hypothetical protein